jgi:DNA-directed RNA polymerase I subunit RPA1
MTKKIRVLLSCSFYVLCVAVIANTLADMKKKASKYLTPLEVQEYLRLLWEQEQEMLDHLFGAPKLENARKTGKVVRKSSFMQFFMDVIPVPPTRFRPMSRMGDKVFDHPQNGYLNEIIKQNERIIHLRTEDKEAQAPIDEESKTKEEGGKPASTFGGRFKQTIDAWIALQENVNNLNDSTKNPKSKQSPPGIKQLLEKKEGLFRKHMMVSHEFA